MRNALLLVTALAALFAFAGSTPTAAPPLEELALASFPPVTAQELIEGAQPRTAAIQHVSPENFTNTVTFSSALPPLITGKNLVTSHTLTDAGVAPLAVESFVGVFVDGGVTWPFQTAFSWPPICTCSVNLVPARACGVTAATTTNVVFSGIVNSTDTVTGICLGAR